MISSQQSCDAHQALCCTRWPGSHLLRTARQPSPQSCRRHARRGPRHLPQTIRVFNIVLCGRVTCVGCRSPRTYTIAPLLAGASRNTFTCDTHVPHKGANATLLWSLATGTPTVQHSGCSQHAALSKQVPQLLGKQCVLKGSQAGGHRSGLRSNLHSCGWQAARRRPAALRPAASGGALAGCWAEPLQAARALLTASGWRPAHTRSRTPAAGHQLHAAHRLLLA